MHILGLIIFGIIMIASILAADAKRRERAHLRLALEQESRKLRAEQAELLAAEADRRLREEAAHRAAFLPIAMTRMGELIDPHSDVLWPKFCRHVSVDEYGKLAIGKAWQREVSYFVRNVLLNDVDFLRALDGAAGTPFHSLNRTKQRQRERRIEEGLTSDLFALYEYARTLPDGYDSTQKLRLRLSPPVDL